MDNAPLCACGCGKPTKLRRYPSQGVARFLQGHQHKGPNNGNYRGGKIKRACGVCMKEYVEYPSVQSKTCSSDTCHRTWQSLTSAARGRKKIAIACTYCGGMLSRYPSQVRPTVFCNQFCQAEHQKITGHGINNGRWKGGCRLYWQQQARRRDNQRCAICGFDLFVEVHHITPLSQGGTNDLSNLITVCPNHHRLAHSGVISLEHLRRDDWAPDLTAALAPRANH